MKVCMLRKPSGTYCVFSETVMNCSNSSTEAEALADFYKGDTFDPSQGRAQYRLNTNCTECYHANPSNSSFFATVIYEIASPTDISTYEYW